MPYLSALQDSGAFVFCWDQSALARMKEYGITRAAHFAMAVNPRLFRRDRDEVASDPAIPVLFVGGPDPSRNRHLAPLPDLGLRIFGYEPEGWDAGLRTCHAGEVLERPMLRRAYNRARISVNVTRAHGRSSLNMRVYEAMACGSLMITDDKPDTRALFCDGEHLVIYRDERDLRRKVDYYLSHEDERRAIADAGMRKVHAEHTYDLRLKAIEPVLDGVFSEHRLLAKLDEYAARDAGKAREFVRFLRADSRVTEHRDVLACKSALIELACGDRREAEAEIGRALAENPNHLEAMRLAASLGAAGKAI